MRCISSIEIRNFRSCRDVLLPDLRGSNAIVGANNVGKSNILRAVSLFFTGHPEPGTALDFTSDYGGPRGAKREIQVTIYFELPDSFRFPKKAKSTADLLGREFSIRKVWRPERPSPTISVRPEDKQEFSSGQEAVDAAETFVGLMNFRYLPSERRPSNVIAQERESIRAELMRRFKSVVTKSSEAEDEDVLAPLQSVAARLLHGVSDAIADQVTGVDGVRLRTPQTLADAIAELGYEVVMSDGRTFDETTQGSGVQSSLMFRLLHLSDTAFPRHFGWKQQVIWAVEEPELFLHTSLEWELSAFLQEQATAPDGRMQVMMVTHSEVFMRRSDVGYLVKFRNNQSDVRELTPDEIIHAAARSGISRAEHAILREPDIPLIVTEGKTDPPYLERAWELLYPNERVVIAAVNQLSGEASGGSSKIAPFLDRLGPLIACRPPEGPVIALLDWNENDRRLQEIEGALSVHSTSHAIRMAEDKTNPELDQQFTGIERYLPTKMIEVGHDRGWYELKTPKDADRPYTVDRSEFDGAKARLASYFEEAATETDLTFLKPIVQAIKRTIDAANQSQSQEEPDVTESE